MEQTNYNSRGTAEIKNESQQDIFQSSDRRQRQELQSPLEERKQNEDDRKHCKSNEDIFQLQKGKQLQMQ